MTNPPAERVRRLPSTGRVEAFSDGVLAIAITLLVLDLRAPTARGRFLHDLGSEWQSYVAYLATFLIIGTFWLTHHSLFTRLAYADGPVLILNLGALLLVSALPFPTAIISAAFRGGDGGDQIVAIIVYCVIGCTLSLAWSALTGYLARHPQLCETPREALVIGGERRRQLAAVIPPLLGIGIAFASPIAALVLQAVTPLVYLMTIAGSRRVDGLAE